MDRFGAHTKAADNNQAALRRAALVQVALAQPPRQPATLADEVRLAARSWVSRHQLETCSAARGRNTRLDVIQD